MLRVFSLKVLAVFLLVSFFMTSTVLSLSSKPADAATVSREQVSSFPSGALGLIGLQESTLATMVRPAWPSWDDIASFGNEIGCDAAHVVGAGLSFFTGVCDDTLVGSVGDGARSAVDCGLDIQACVTNWIYDVVGSGVSWVATGIVSLVTSTHEECLPGANSGSGDWGKITVACENRINSDYFPSGYTLDNRENSIMDVVVKSYADQRRDIRAEMRTLRTSGQGNSDRYKYLKAQLDIITGRTDQAPLSDSLTAGALRRQATMFTIPKSALSTSTWDREYGKYVLFGVMLLVPMIIAGALQAVITGKAGLMARSVILVLPISIFGMIVAPWLVRTLMAITDNFSSFIISDVQGDVDGYFSNMSITTAQAMGVPLLLGFVLVAIIFIFAALMIWFVLSMREASVALIAVFLPVAFAASVWPALSKWSIRAIKLLVAAIISKIFIVGAIALGLGTFAGATESGNISTSHMIFGATIFFIASFSPHLVMKFFDEIGDAINAAGQTGIIGRGLNTMANTNAARNLLGMGGGGGGIGGVGGGAAGNGGGPSGHALARQDGNKAAKDSLAGGSSKPAAGLAGAKEAAQSGAAQGQSSREQGAAAGEVYKAHAGDGHVSMGTPGGSTMTNSQLAGGLAAGEQARQEGQSAEGIATATGMGAGGAGANPQAAGELAYGTARSQGLSHDQAQQIGHNVERELSAKPSDGMSKAQLRDRGVKSVGKAAAIGTVAGPIGSLLMAARRSSKNQDALRRINGG